MKQSILVILLICAVFLYGEEAPLPILRMGRTIETKIQAWQMADAVSLTETMKEPFAKNGWRIVFERPFAGGKEKSVQGALDPDDPRNIAELILLSGNPDIEKVRPKLMWRAEPGELKTCAVYLGRGWNHHLFLRADIATISAIREVVHPQGGDDLYPVFAEALNVEDLNQTTARAAASLLPAGGNRVIPWINQAIGLAVLEGKEPVPHFMALKGIGTPEAVNAFLAAMRSKVPKVVESAESVLLLPPAMKGADNLYLYLLAHRKNVSACLIAITQLGIGKKALPVVQKLALEPDSYIQLTELVFSEYKFRTGNKIVPEADLIDQIKILMARNGDLPGTPRVYSVSEKADELDAKLMELERKRIAPLEEQFRRSENLDCAIVSALSLCAFRPPKKTFQESYVRRVNEEGFRLLKMLDRQRVIHILRRLKNRVENPEEADFFESLLNRIQ